MVYDVSMSDITLECGIVTFQGWGELPILFGHLLGEKPGDGISGSVLVLKGLLELSKEVVPGPKGDCSADDGFLIECISPG